MKKILPLTILFLILIFVLTPTAYSATVVFKTGFEPAVALDAATAASQFWADGRIGEAGLVDASTGYNVPFDFPGKCYQDNTCSGSGSNAYVPHFISNTAIEGNYAEISNEKAVNGTYSLKTVQGSSGRVAMAIYPASAGDPYETHDRISSKFYAYWAGLDTLPNNSWSLFFELRGPSNEYNMQFLWSKSSGGDEYLQFKIQNRTVGDTQVYPYIEDVDFSDWSDKWVEVIIFLEPATDRVILKMKPVGGSESVIFNENSYDLSDSENPEPLSVLKNYGTNIVVYYDDFALYNSTGYTDLPDWDFDIANPSPTGPGIGIDTDLNWTNPTGENTNDGYFKVGACPTEAGDVVWTNQAHKTTYDPGTLAENTVHCWRVDIDHDGGTQTGIDYTFTTTTGPPAPPAGLAIGVYSSSGLTGVYDDQGATVGE